MTGEPTNLHVMEGEGIPDALHVRVTLLPSSTNADTGETETCGGSENIQCTKNWSANG